MRVDDRLGIALDAAVPLEIQRLIERGGPHEDDLRACRDFAAELCSHGDVLMFGGGRKGQAAELFTKLARALAVMSFAPDGVRFLGRHWKAADHERA